MSTPARLLEEVFTPRSPPTRDMFTRRNEPDVPGNPGLQDLLRETLREPGSQILLYGDAGVGKTTLLQYAAEDEGMEFLLIQCMSSRSFAGHVDTALRELVERREVQVVSGAANERERELGVSKVITLRGKLTRRKEEARHFDTMSQEPVLELADVLKQDGRRLLVFDNFQNVDQSEIRFFAQAAEILSDISSQTDDVKMVLVGAAEHAHLLVGGSRSLRRRITEIEVPRMPDGEIDEILGNGFRLLGLTPAADAVARLIFFCDGFPYFAHRLGLDVARIARNQGVAEVNQDHVNAALERTARSVEASIDERVRQAFERSGEFQPRRRILELLAASHERQWTVGDIVATYGTTVPSGAEKRGHVSGALSQLVKPEYGAVLRRSGSRGRYRYGFSDPFFRPFLRMKYVTSDAPERVAARERDPALRATRRSVTVVFCEVVGSTRLGEQLDPETFRGVLTRYLDTARAAFEAHGGTVEKYVGDAVMAVFGVPVLHEDDASRALRAAEQLLREVARLNAGAAPQFGALDLRIGVNTGEVVVAGEDALVTGDVVVTAARLASAAPPGDVLMGPATYELGRGSFVLEAAAPVQIKGRSQPLPSYRLVSARRTSTAPAWVPDRLFINRASEVAALRASLDEAISNRDCRLATVVGPAGIGKTSLARHVATDAGDVQILWGRCLPYGEGISFWPLLEITRYAAGLDTAAGHDAVRARLAALLTGADGGDHVADTMAAVVRGDDVKAQEVLWAGRRLLEELAREQPLVAVFDDLQWAEPTFLELLSHVLDHSRGFPLLICCLARSEFLELHPGWLAERPRARTIRLDLLQPDEIARLVRERYGLDDEALRRVTESAGGIPLFAEQLAELLHEGGGVDRAEGIPVPRTITALLSARLERLTPDERVVIERAAAIGRAFSAREVAAIVPAELRNSVGESLDALLQKGLIRPAQSADGATEFRFTHTLLRDTAYGAIPKRERAEMHEQLARWLQRRPPAPADGEAAAFHFDQAARLRQELDPHNEQGAP